MNFKTPFKVLTTAALIGTLAVSAVAPGAASATSASKVSQKATASFAIDKLVFTKEGSAPIVMTYAEYEDAYLLASLTGEDFAAKLNGYKVSYVVTGNQNVYDYTSFEDAYLLAAIEDDTATSAQVLEDLAKKPEGTTTLPADAKEGTFGEDGKLGSDQTPGEEIDFEVTEVAAITQTLPAKKDQAISFTVNGDKTVTAADLIKEGYTVSFKFNKSLTSLTADEQKAAKEEGIVNATKAPFNSDFTYAVEVTDEDGNKFGDATDFKKVTVKDAETAVSVEGVKLVEGTDAVDYVTVGQAGVKFEGTVAKNAFGEELKTVPAVKSVKALNPTVAYYDTATKTIKAEEEGTAKFEVTFEGIETPVTTEVTVKAEAKADSVKETSVKVAKGKTVELTILDQHGKEIAATNTLKYTIAGETPVTGNVTVSDNKAVVPVFNTAGNYTVTITDAEDKTLGTVEVAVVDDSKAVATSYEVTEDSKTDVLGLTVGSTEVGTKGYKVTGYADGLKLDNLVSTVESLKETVGEGQLKVETSNKDVATVAFDGASTDGNIDVTAVKKGTATISLVYVAGDAKKELTKFDVTVKNDTPQYTQENVSLKANTTAIAIAKDQNLDDAIEAGLVYDEKAIAEGSVDTIKDIKVVNQELQADGTVKGDVVFYTTTPFGAKKLTFPAVYAADSSVAEELQLKAVKAGEATTGQYKVLSGAEVTAEEVKVLNKFFATTQEETNDGQNGNTAGTALTIDKTAVTTQVTELKAATAVKLPAVQHDTSAAHVKYAPDVNATWNFSAVTTTNTKGAKAIIDGEKAWYQNGAKTANTEGWSDLGTIKGGITNLDDANSAAYNIKKTAATADKVVYVLGSDDKWYVVTLEASTLAQ